MPLFCHRCIVCDHRFEVLVSARAVEADQPCPACKEPKTIRVISRSSFALRGSGWAKDGYGPATGGNGGSDE
jgi:putative FmdB family regulatory protein